MFSKLDAAFQMMQIKYKLIGEPAALRECQIHSKTTVQ